MFLIHHDTEGMENWINSYHQPMTPNSFQSRFSDPIRTHSGIIQQAINFEFCGSDNYTGIGINYGEFKSSRMELFVLFLVIQGMEINPFLTFPFLTFPFHDSKLVPMVNYLILILFISSSKLHEWKIFQFFFMNYPNLLPRGFSPQVWRKLTKSPFPVSRPWSNFKLMDSQKELMLYFQSESDFFFLFLPLSKFDKSLPSFPIQGFEYSFLLLHFFSSLDTLLLVQIRD